MGKLVLIVIILMVIILSTIFISLRNRTEISYDDIALRNTQNESKLLSNYAMQYGIKLLDNEDELPNSEDVPFTKTFDPAFAVRDGFIDSLVYTLDDSSNVILNAHVTYNKNARSVSSISRAVLQPPLPSTINIDGLPYALSAKHDILIQTKSTLNNKGINGDVFAEGEIGFRAQGSVSGDTTTEGAFPDFAAVFGITLEEMKLIADYVGTNPASWDGITIFMNDDGSDGNFTINANVVGNGILVIVGDAKINGNFNFNGIIWITGSISGLGNGHIFGTIFCADNNPNTESLIQGSFLLEYDPDLLTGKTFSTNKSSGKHKILAVYEDIRN